MHATRLRNLAGAAILLCAAASGDGAEQPDRGLNLSWDANYLTVRGNFSGGTLKIHYLEAYCRPGSTDRDWAETVIGHKTELLGSDRGGKRLRLRDRLRDGVVVDHEITATSDAVEFELVATNPTERHSNAHWAQPCIRVEDFTGCPADDRLELVPAYARKCFVFLDGQLSRLPTQPWAEEARYTPGQVYCPEDVDRNDVNPRPLSSRVPSNGLMGCFSRDESQILAIAWQPYQELFLGVITCIHSDFRIAGLAPGQSKKIRGKLYLVDADVAALVRRYRRDFPEHNQRDLRAGESQH